MYQTTSYQLSFPPIKKLSPVEIAVVAGGQWAESSQAAQNSVVVNVFGRVSEPASQ